MAIQFAFLLRKGMAMLTWTQTMIACKQNVSALLEVILLRFHPVRQNSETSLPFSSYTDGRLTKIIERLEDGQEPLLKGPETVILGPSGELYAFARGAKLVRLDDIRPTDDPQTKTARVTIAKNLGNGAPLGGKFSPDGNTLWIADPMLGLARIRNFQDPKSKLEIVASQVIENGIMSRILFADDVAIGPKTGKIYFSDGKLWHVVASLEHGGVACKVKALTEAFVSIYSYGDPTRSSDRRA